MFATALPGRFESIELDPNDGDSDQCGIVDCFGEKIANSTASWVNAKIAATLRLNGLQKIRTARKIAASRRQRFRGELCGRQNRTVLCNNVKRASVRLRAYALQLPCKGLNTGGIVRVSQSIPHVSVKREDNR